MYCVYLTTYRGTHLPMFYIGSSSVERVNNGYKGSVSSIAYKNIWKEELKNNSHLFKTKIISTHVSSNEARSKELELQEKLNVVKSPMYINMSTARVNGFFGNSVTPANKNSRLWNNGKQMKYANESPGKEWTLGELSTLRLAKSRAVRKKGAEHHNFNRKRSDEANAKFVKNASKKYEVTIPNGNIIQIHGLNVFLREHNLNPSGAHGVLNGVKRHYKGYIFRKIS